MQAALAFGFFRVGRRPEKRVKEDANACKNSHDYGQHGFWIGKQTFQRAVPLMTLRIPILSEVSHE
jgi:hypothetical protein